MESLQLTDKQRKALHDISNSGMSHAAVALSQLMCKTIRIKAPRILVMDFASVPEYLGGVQQMVVVVYLKILGDARGNILMVFPWDNAKKMLERLLPQANIKGTLLTEPEASALKEVGNILASAYLNALGEKLKMTLLTSVPALSFNMAGMVGDYALTELGAAGGKSLMINTDFSDAHDHIGGHFFLLPDPPSLAVILEKMGV